MPAPSRRTWDGAAATKKHHVLVGVAFVAAARFLGGQRFVLSRTKTIDYWRRESSNPQSNRGLAPSRSPSLFVIGARVVAALGQRPRPGEYLPAIRECDRCAKRKMGTVPGTIALDRDHISGLNRIFSPALPVEHVRTAALQRPVHHLAVLAFHI